MCCGSPLPSVPVYCGPPLLCTRPGRWPSALQRSRMAQVPPLLSSGPYLLAQEQRPSVLWPSVLQSSVQWRLCCGPPVWRRSLHCFRPAPIFWRRSSDPLCCGPPVWRRSLIAGAGPMAPWRRSVFIEGACTANVASVLSNGAGPIGKIGPAPESWETCTGELGDLHHVGGGPAPHCGREQNRWPLSPGTCAAQ